VQGDARMEKRRVLLLASGLSPQIVTETLYALAVARKPRWVPDEVHLITTAKGKERALSDLLAPKTGWFHRLREEYDLPPIQFDSRTIHLLTDATGRPLEDIRTEADNEAAADAIVDLVRCLTMRPETELHVSIAGGRKTMGFFLGYALSLYGRVQDTMSHVLVSEPYESHPEFFYPSRRQRMIRAPDGKMLDTSDARIWLAEIPYVRMRLGVPEELIQGKVRYLDVVQAVESSLAKARIRLLPKQKKVETPLGVFELPPVDFAFYWWLADLRRERRESGYAYCPKDGLPDRKARDDYLSYLRRISNDGFSGHYGRTERGLRDGMTRAFFQERKSRINQRIRQALKTQQSPYEIVRWRLDDGRYGFGLWHLAPEAIEVRE